MVAKLALLHEATGNAATFTELGGHLSGIPLQHVAVIVLAQASMAVRGGEAPRS